MKKLLLILAIGAFVACNDDGADEGTNADTSTIVTPDTATVTPAPDTTTVTPDTSATARPDSTK